MMAEISYLQVSWNGFLFSVRDDGRVELGWREVKSGKDCFRISRKNV